MYFNYQKVIFHLSLHIELLHNSKHLFFMGHIFFLLSFQEMHIRVNLMQ